MMEMSEAVSYTNLAQRDAVHNELETYAEYHAYTDINELQVPTDTDDTGYLEPVRQGQHDTVPTDTGATGYSETVSQGQHDTPIALRSSYLTMQAPGIQNPPEQPATPRTIQHSYLELQSTAEQSSTSGLAKQKKLILICAILPLIAFGVGLAVGSTLLYRGLDHCESSPCQNGGECFPGLESFICNCTAAFTGAYCQTGVDERASNPCATHAVYSNGLQGYTCICNGTVTHRDCEEIRNAMCSVSGVYTVTPRGGTPTQVYCDMDTDSGDWLAFQNRVDGSVDFYLNWASYAAGFGDLNGEFWLGNHNLHLLTAQKNYTLRVVLSDWEGNQTYAQYSRFTIGSEQDKFRLTVDGYNGTAGDSLSYHDGMQFSAKDQDHDVDSNLHCAQLLRGAWWYRWCGYSSLNGRYQPDGPYTGQSQTGWPDRVKWPHWRGDWYSLKSTRMMIRPAP